MIVVSLANYFDRLYLIQQFKTPIVKFHECYGILLCGLNTFTARPIFPGVPSPGRTWFSVHCRCQLVICCGAGVWLSYMYRMTSILVRGTYRHTLIDEITRQWQRTIWTIWVV